MKISFKKGYSVYEISKNPVLVAPHSGPALEVTTSRDDNSETVASLCLKSFGGTLVISNSSRKRVWGIDFNRDIPKKAQAIRMFNGFFNESFSSKEELYNYRKKYAWVAKDEEDYNQRLKIYNGFWDEIIKRGNNVLLFHRIFPRIKALPSILDIITFDGKGINKGLSNKIVKRLNSKYFNFLKSIELPYKKMVRFEEERVINQIIKVYGSFDLKSIKGEFKENLLKDLKVIRKYSDKSYFKQLQNNFTPHNFLRAVDNALINIGPPEITIENVYKGELAHGPKNKLPLKMKKVIEIESSRFLNFWYPSVVVEMVGDILKTIKKG